MVISYGLKVPLVAQYELVVGGLKPRQRSATERVPIDEGLRVSVSAIIASRLARVRHYHQIEVWQIRNIYLIWADARPHGRQVIPYHVISLLLAGTEVSAAALGQS